MDHQKTIGYAISLFLLLFSGTVLPQPLHQNTTEGEASNVIARQRHPGADSVPTVRSVLLEQLRNSHTAPNWYVPLADALRGLTAEQAHQTDSMNHSICQIASHLLFWNERMITAFRGDTPPYFDDNNNETFTQYCTEDWPGTVEKLDSVQTAWEREITSASEEQLKRWSSEVANLSSHNAYHTGQIVYIRKMNGWWKASQGVK